MSGNDLEDLAFIVSLIIALIVLVMVSYVVASIIAFVIATYRYHKYRREARKTYDQIADEVGASWAPDEVLRALYGVGVKLSETGWDNPIDWLEGAVMGAEVFDR